MPAFARISRDRPRAAGHEVRGLEHDGVAVRERGRDLPRRNRDRKVPRRDEADDADRLARHLDVDAGPHRRQLLAREAQHFAGEELEDVPGARRFADAFGQRLAFLARQQRARARPCARGFRVPTRSRRFERSWIEPVAHAGAASLAAAIAARACAASACAYSPITSLTCRTDCGSATRTRRRPIRRRCSCGEEFGHDAFLRRKRARQRRPRRARLRISAPAPKVHGADLVGVIDAVDERAELRRRDGDDVADDVREALAGSEAVLGRREHRAQEQHEPVRILVVGADRVRDEIERVAADHRHRARAVEREALGAVDAHRELAAAHVVDAEIARRTGG